MVFEEHRCYLHRRKTIIMFEEHPCYLQGRKAIIMSILKKKSFTKV